MIANKDLYDTICSQVHSIDYYTRELFNINSAKRHCIASCRRSQDASKAKLELEKYGFDVPVWIIDALSDPNQWSE